MPADERFDQPHESTKIAAASPYGCRGPRAEGYWAQDGWHTVKYSDPRWSPGKPVWVWVYDVMSKTCNYDRWTTDPRCVGCEREKA